MLRRHARAPPFNRLCLDACGGLLRQCDPQVVAFTLSPSEINKLRDQFKVFDSDGSGTVSLTEFRAGMEKHGMDPKSIAELFSKVGDLSMCCRIL